MQARPHPSVSLPPTARRPDQSVARFASVNGSDRIACGVVRLFRRASSPPFGRARDSHAFFWLCAQSQNVQIVSTARVSASGRSVNLRKFMDQDDVDPEDPPIPSVQWDIRREGRAWDGAEAQARWNLTPEKFEMWDGKLFWSHADRITLLGLLLENVGVDAAVRLGDPAVWRAAVRDLG